MVSQDVDIVLNQGTGESEVSQSKAHQAMAECKESLNRLLQNPEDDKVFGMLVYDFVDKFLYAYEASSDASKGSKCDLSRGGVTSAVPSLSPLQYVFTYDILAPQALVDLRRRLRELFAGIFKIMLQHIPAADLVRRITRAVVNARPECRFNVDAMDVILRGQFVNFAIFDQHLLTQMDSGNNFQATYFAQKLTKMYMMDRNRTQPITNLLPLTCELLSKIQQTNSRTPDA